MWSASVTPRLSDKKGQIGKAKPKIPSGNISAFQDYMPTMMSALGNLGSPLVKGLQHPLGQWYHHWCSCPHQGHL